MKDLKKKIVLPAKRIVVVKRDDVIGRRLVRQEADIKVEGYAKVVEPKGTLKSEFYRRGAIVL